MVLAPIAVMSFRRPEKLKEVLLALRGQVACEIEGREIHLFQDNAINRYSRMRYADDAEVAQCVDVFSELFPKGTVHLSDANIGVAENFERAENFLFDEKQVECAYFFEDDLVLSPAYVQMLDLMQVRAKQIGNIAYFACYGDYYNPPARIDDRARQLIPLDHHWGFGLFAKQRMAIRREIQPYLDIVMGADYSRRDHHAIYGIYQEKGSCPRGSSQDAAKAHACARLGFWRCNTALPFAQYTGDVGAHMNKELFEKIGFDRVEVAQTPVVNLEWPSKPEIRGYVEEQRALFRSIAQNEIEDLRKGLGRYLNPMRLCTRDDIIHAYRLFLYREPENSEVVEQHVAKTPVFVYVRSILSSDEHKNIGERKIELLGHLDPHRLCTKEEIQAAYNLLIHRLAEKSEIFDRNVGKVSVLEFCSSILKSEELQKIWNRMVV